MARLNLTLDASTYAELEKHARKLGKPRAKVVKEILSEGLARRIAVERRKKLTEDYKKSKGEELYSSFIVQHSSFCLFPRFHPGYG